MPFLKQDHNKNMAFQWLHTTVDDSTKVTIILDKNNRWSLQGD